MPDKVCDICHSSMGDVILGTPSYGDHPWNFERVQDKSKYLKEQRGIITCVYSKPRLSITVQRLTGFDHKKKRVVTLEFCPDCTEYLTERITKHSRKILPEKKRRKVKKEESK